MGNFGGNDRFGGDRRGGGGNRSGGGGGFRNNFRPPQIHKTTCAECGTECEVPFKPMEGRPVFCRNCYAKKKEY